MMRNFLASLLVLAAGALPLRASTIIGPGNNAPGQNDGAGSLSIVDLANSQSLSAGQYKADQFNYAFVTTPNATSNGQTIEGDVEPFLAIADPANPGHYEVIAVGASVPYTGDVGYGVHPFGGTSAKFTLLGTTTVYAGFYWDFNGTGGGSPIGFTNSAGNDYINYSGASLPTVGSDLSGTSTGTFPRTYDFAVEVSVVPEPSSLVAICGLGAIGLLLATRFCRSKSNFNNI